MIKLQPFFLAEISADLLKKECDFISNFFSDLRTFTGKTERAFIALGRFCFAYQITVFSR